MISMGFRKAKHFNFFLVVSAFGISLISFGYFPAPFLWIALTWFLVALFASAASTNSTIKAISINIGAVIMALGIFEGYEAYLNHKAAYKLPMRYEEGYFAPHDFLGTAPHKPREGFQHFSSSRYFKKEILYDVVYTIDSNGLRIGPFTNNSNNSAQCVLFYGCSFTFGEGLNDDETMPYLVGIKSNGTYHTYNFGFHGYGAHQMLAALEHGLEEKVVPCKPKYAVYAALMDHIRRSAGLVPYDKNGPRYTLNQNGEVILTGRFVDYEKSFISWIKKRLRKSYILRETILKENPFSSDNISLFVSIVDRARTIFENRYPGSQFYVLFWDKFVDQGGIGDREKVLHALDEKGIRAHLISNILQNDKSEYLIKLDGHPNAFANKLIAEYVIDNILGK